MQYFCAISTHPRKSPFPSRALYLLGLPAVSSEILGAALAAVDDPEERVAGAPPLRVEAAQFEAPELKLDDAIPRPPQADLDLAPVFL